MPSIRECQYEYLVTSVILALLALALILALPSHRRLLLCGAALSAPLALFSHFFIPWYWRPVLTYHSVTSPEDVLYSSSIGVYPVLFAALISGNRFVCESQVMNCVRRSCRCLMPIAGLWVVCHLLLGPAHVMHSSLISLITLGVYLFRLRRNMWLEAVVGGLGFMIFHVLVIQVGRFFWPDSYLTQWNPAAQLPFTILGIPGFEVTWAFLFGLVWPLLVVHVLESPRVPGEPGVGAVESA